MSFTPSWVSPPGDTIRDVLAARRWSPHELAERLGVSVALVRGLLTGRERLTPALAEALARVIGHTAAFWREREQYYREELVRRRKSGTAS